MSYQALEMLVGEAIIDQEFRSRLLNGQRPHILQQYDLTPEERRMLLSIQANSLEEFAACIYHWLQTQTHPGGATPWLAA
ncbi:MAG TPA: hypothetical protein ENK56_08865 [Chloroflexi bacterium]|nr:hypothetical protein [Chloroflexota bacterium]